jgi:hypothetical protein
MQEYNTQAKRREIALRLTRALLSFVPIIGVDV